MMERRRSVVAADVETTKSLGQMPRYLADRYVPAVPIRIGQPVQQKGRRAGKRDFEVQRKRFIVDSDHAQHQNKNGTLSQS